MESEIKGFWEKPRVNFSQYATKRKIRDRIVLLNVDANF
jgi:hypothetical protein